MSLARKVPGQPQERPSGLEHDLLPYLERLAVFESSSEMEKSDLFSRLVPEIERVMGTIVQENLAPISPRHCSGRIRAVAWNVERGTQLEGTLDVLRTHPRSLGADVLLLTELDLGMVRSGNRFIAREIADALGLNYAFANCYISLVKGSGLEYHLEGENTLALHGNALFSRFPLDSVHAIALPNGKDKMVGKEKRLGYQQAVAGIVRHPAGDFWAVSLHLDAHSTQPHRYRQMKLVLDHLDGLTPKLPVLIGGDWNTSTYNSSRALYTILGYCRRVAMGVNHVVRNHYPYPDRWFERRLFAELRRRGYDYETLNQPGACTLHYEVDDLAVNTNMGDWIPAWCFWFIRWALKRTGGKCGMKLDWFAGRGIRHDPELPPRVLSEVHSRVEPLSDHDPIVLDFFLESGGETSSASP